MKVHSISWKGYGRDAHFLPEREWHEIDDKLLGRANVRAGVLGLSRPLAADANPDRRRVVTEHIEKGERSSVYRAPCISGRDPGDRRGQNRYKQQFVLLGSRHLLESELHSPLPGTFTLIAHRW
jgi:hypothetical protein